MILYLNSQGFVIIGFNVTLKITHRNPVTKLSGNPASAGSQHCLLGIDIIITVLFQFHNYQFISKLLGE